MNLLQCKSLCKVYNDKLTLKDISFEIGKGDIIGILGENGSGKSTLMSIIAGVQNATSGEILVDKKAITRENRLKIGYVPQEPVFLENITALDNIKLWQGIYGIDNYANIPDFLEIQSFSHKKIFALSGGMKKKVAIAISLMNNPEFLILDEAFSALDAKTVNYLIDYLLNRKDIGILFSGHSKHETQQLCNKTLALNNGRLEDTYRL